MSAYTKERLMILSVKVQQLCQKIYEVSVERNQLERELAAERKRADASQQVCCMQSNAHSETMGKLIAMTGESLINLHRAERAEAELIALREKHERLLVLAKREHYQCEDSWYSCPASPEGSANEGAGTECDCGADKWNNALRAALGEGK